jgi:hypothetical protein
VRVLKNKVIGVSGSYTFKWCNPGEVIFVSNPNMISHAVVTNGLRYITSDEDHTIYVTPDAPEQILR